MKRTSNILALDKDWWKQDREPGKFSEIVARPKRKAAALTYLTVQEVADRLRVGIWAMYSYLNRPESDNRLQSQRVGRRRLIATDDLEDFLLRENARSRT